MLNPPFHDRCRTTVALILRPNPAYLEEANGNG